MANGCGRRAGQLVGLLDNEDSVNSRIPSTQGRLRSTSREEMTMTRIQRGSSARGALVCLLLIASCGDDLGANHGSGGARGVGGPGGGGGPPGGGGRPRGRRGARRGGGGGGGAAAPP